VPLTKIYLSVRSVRLRRDDRRRLSRSTRSQVIAAGLNVFRPLTNPATILQQSDLEIRARCNLVHNFILESAKGKFRTNHGARLQHFLRLIRPVQVCHQRVPQGYREAAPACLRIATFQHRPSELSRARHR